MAATARPHFLSLSAPLRQMVYPFLHLLPLQNEAPHPWISRLRIWDSVGTYVPVKTTSPSSIITSAAASSPLSSSGGPYGSSSPTAVTAALYASSTSTSSSTTALYQQMLNRTVGTYYGTTNKHGKSLKINVDNVWNPVDQYIYGPTVNSIFNQPPQPPQPQHQSGIMGDKGLVFGAGIGLQEKMPKYSSGSGKGSKDASRYTKDGLNDVVKEHGGSSGRREKSGRSNRRLLAEFYDNEAPKLCDHVSLETKGNRMRPCTPLESYVSTGSDLVSFVDYVSTIRNID